MTWKASHCAKLSQLCPECQADNYLLYLCLSRWSDDDDDDELMSEPPAEQIKPTSVALCFLMTEKQNWSWTSEMNQQAHKKSRSFQNQAWAGRNKSRYEIWLWLTLHDEITNCWAWLLFSLPTPHVHQIRRFSARYCVIWGGYYVPSSALWCSQQIEQPANSVCCPTLLLIRLIWIRITLHHHHT